VVNAIAEIHIPITWWAKQRFVAGNAPAVAVAGGLGLAIRLRFHNHAPQQLVIGLAFHQQATDQHGATSSAGRAKKAWGSVVAMGVAWE